MDYKDAQQVRQAAQLIREGGLCKYALRDGSIYTRSGEMILQGSHCLVGALIDSGYASELNRNWGDVMPLVEDTIRMQYPELYPNQEWYIDAVDWNNRTETTADDVIAVLEKTAQRIEDGLL